MLCPEVLNFKEPASVFHNQTTQDTQVCLKKITEFNFVHLVTVVLPDTLNVPESFGEELTHNDYYKICSLNISELVKPDFLTNFIECGELSRGIHFNDYSFKFTGNVNLLSINTRIDCDNCVAITPSGKLFLNLDKFTFQTLGLEGKVSKFHTKSKEKYNVIIDLKSPSFRPGKPNYERTKSCLEKLENFDVIIAWDPPEKSICPSSIAKYFSDQNYTVKLCKIRKDSDTIYSVKIPTLTDEIETESLTDFVEWLGMICLDANLNETLDFISTYKTPEPNCYVGQVRIICWRGFFSSQTVAEFMQNLQKHFGSNQFWKALYFQGFSDSPVVWGNDEHHFYTNGDNASVIVINKENIHMCFQKCSNRRYK